MTLNRLMPHKKRPLKELDDYLAEGLSLTEAIAAFNRAL